MTFSDAICCLFLILIGALIVSTLIRSRKKKSAEQEKQPEVKMSPDEYLHQGFLNLELGNRQAAANAFLYVYRHGRPALRQQALQALEGMGQVETF